MALQSTTYTAEDRLGVGVIVTVGILSTLSVITVCARICTEIVRGRRKAFVRRPLDVYFYFLLFFDLVQAIGNILNIRWIADSEVVNGRYCTTQGIIKQIGDVGIAWAVMLIALQTCLGTFLQSVTLLRKLWIAWIVQLLVILLIVGSILGGQLRPPLDSPYYGDTGFWCWITTERESEQIGLDYVFMWLALLIIFTCYMSLVLRYFGCCGGDRRSRARQVTGRRYHFVRRTDPNVDKNDPDAPMLTVTINGADVLTERETWLYNVFYIDVKRFSRADASYRLTAFLAMGLYPPVYGLTISPISIARFLAFGGVKVDFSVTVCADAVYGLSGFFNAVLFSMTRPYLYRDPGDKDTTLPPHWAEENIILDTSLVDVAAEDAAARNDELKMDDRS